MTKKPTYEELQQRVKELEKEAVEHKHAKEEFQTILNAVPVMIFQKDKDGKTIRTNQAFDNMIGLSKEEIIGKTTDELFPEHGKDMMKDDQEVMELGKPKLDIIEHYDSPEGTRWARTGKAPLKDKEGNVVGLIGYAADITEQKQIEEALRESEEFNRALFEYNPIQTVVVDLEGRVTSFNLAKKNSGDRLPNIGDVMYKDYAGKHETDMYAELMKCVRSGKTRRFPERKYSDKLLSIMVSPFYKGAIIATEDITEHKKNEEALRQAAALETLSTVLENFIGDSLSNLLTPIYGQIELCEIRDSIEQIKGELGNIKGNITKLLTGISAYRKFTKAGESSLGKISSVDISSILGPFFSGQPLKTYEGEEFPIDPKVKLQFTYNPKQKGSVSWEELPSVSGSNLAVATALQETLINAVESYDPKKGGDVVVSAKKEGYNLILEIADKGRGMSNEEREKSQLPFFKILGIKGSARLGLGAYIARQSAKYCEGDIHIESRETLGTTASIILKISDKVS